MKVRERLAALLQDIRTDLDTCQQLEKQLLEQQRLLSRQEGPALTRARPGHSQPHRSYSSAC